MADASRLKVMVQHHNELFHY